jgi:hypothetical protein
MLELGFGSHKIVNAADNGLGNTAGETEPNSTAKLEHTTTEEEVTRLITRST